MSRFVRYPLYVKGNPQCRVFFTDFYMKLLKSDKDRPSNVVTFECPIQMTKFDVKNYLDRLYNIPVAKVNTQIVYVAFKRDHRNRRFKPKDDFKLAHVTLPDGKTFQFPDNLFKKEEDEDEQDLIDEVKAKQKEKDNRLRERGGISPWFGV